MRMFEMLEDLICIMAYFLPQFIKDFLDIDRSLYAIMRERS